MQRKVNDCDVCKKKDIFISAVVMKKGIGRVELCKKCANEHISEKVMELMAYGELPL